MPKVKATVAETTSSASAISIKNKVSIHWFRNGLRFHDNPVLKRACDESETLLLLYIIYPDAPFEQSIGIRPGCIRSNFVLESIQEIYTKVQTMPLVNDDSTTTTTKQKQQMIVLLGKYEEILPKVIKAINADALYYEQEVAHPIREHDRIVLAEIDKLNAEHKVTINSMSTHTLHPMEVYLSKCKGNVAPTTYGVFTKLFEGLKVPKEVDTITSLPKLPTNAIQNLQSIFGSTANVDFTVPTLQQLGYTDSDIQVLQTRGKGGYDFIGGEDAAVTLLTKMMARSQWVATFEKPKTSPNALSVDTTGLSPYVKHGCLSPRRFFHELSKVYSKYNSKNISKPPVSLHGQLMWREFNYLTGYTTPNYEKMIGNPMIRQIPWDDDPELLAAWEHSRTGYPFIDAIMTQLRETGWIHHLARHAVACFLTRGDLWQSWEKGTTIFEKYLVDADWSLNNFNWQWLSCSSHFYQYFRCYSPAAFGKKTDPNGDYIRKWLPQFKSMPAKYIYEPWDAPIELQRSVGVIIGENYPHPIVDHKVMSKSNMSRMKDAYDAQKDGQPMPQPPIIREDAILPNEPPKKKRKQ